MKIKKKIIIIDITIIIHIGFGFDFFRIDIISVLHCFITIIFHHIL